MNEERIFAEAIQIEDAERRATFLDQVCADDQALRDGVEALLKSHSEARSFLEVPVLDSSQATVVTGTDDILATGGNSDEATLDDLRFLKPSESESALGTLGHYEVLSEVGRGGLGVVLKARDTRLDRIVAIKVPTSEYAAIAAVRQRFTREAKSAAAVRHDDLVTIHAVEEDRGIPYLVMEYIDGISLQDAIDRDGPLELKEILRIGIQTARGLAAAHEQGLVHRDIKPANILLENGIQRVKITDFGLARAVDDVSMTQTGTVAGTPQYMSPEQAHAEQVDHRSDLFSLGSVLYVMCTGRAAFRANSMMAVLKRVCEDDPKPIRQVNPEIPEWLCEIVEKLLEKRPEDRFQSAGEVADLLNRHLAHLQQPEANPQPARLRPASRQADKTTQWRLKVVHHILAILGCCSVGWFFVALLAPSFGLVGPGFRISTMLLSFIVGMLALFGASSIGARYSRRWAIASCLALMLPLSPVWIITLPLSMVALGTLMRRDVKAAFRLQPRRTGSDDERAITTGSTPASPAGEASLLARCRRRYRNANHRWGDAAIIAALLLVVAIGYVVRSGGVQNAWNNIAVALGINYPEYPKLAPWEDFRWDDDVAYAKIDGKWYEVVEIESIPPSELIVAADAMYADPKKRIVEDLAEVLGRIGRYGGDEAVTLSLRDVETDVTDSGTSVPMTAMKRNHLLEAIYGKFRPREPSLAVGGSWPPMSAVAAPDDDFFTVTRDGELVRIRIQDTSIETSVVKDLGAPYDRVEGLALGEDGALYAAVGLGISFTPDQLHRIDTSTGEAELIGKMSHANVEGLTFDADGDLLGVVSDAGRAKLIGIHLRSGGSWLVSGNIDVDLDSLVIDGSGRLLTTDGMLGVDKFYLLDRQRAEPATLLAQTPPVEYNRDVEGLTLGSDGYLYAVTDPDHESPSCLVRIDPETFEHHNLGSLGFGAASIVAVPRPPDDLYCVTRDSELVRIRIDGVSVESRVVRELGPPYSEVEGLAFGHDGALYASVNFGASPAQLHRIDRATGQAALVGRMNHAQVDGLAFDASGALLGVVSAMEIDEPGRLIEIDPATGESEAVSGELSLGDLDSLVIDGRRVLTTNGIGVDDHFYRLDRQGAEPATKLAPTPKVTGDRDIEGLTLGSDGSLYAVTNPDHEPASYLLRIDPETFEYQNLGSLGFGAMSIVAVPREAMQEPDVSTPTRINEVRTFTGTTQPIKGIAWFPDGARVAATSTDGKLRIWDVDTSPLLQSIDVGRPLAALAISPDARYAVVGFDIAGDGAIEIWNIETEELTAVLDEHSTRVTEFAFSEDGRLLLSCGYDRVMHLWDFESRAVRHTFPLSNPDAVSLSPDGRYAALRDENDVSKAHLLDATTGESVHTFEIAEPVKLLRTTFSTDASRIVTAAVSGLVQIWDTNTREELLHVDAHPGPVLDVLLTRDEQFLITTGENDLTLRIWDAATGDLLAETQAETRRFNRLALSPDGSQILTAGGWDWDGTTQTLNTDGDFGLHLYEIPQSIADR